ncbi:MAG: hypothetical protein N0C91_13220 [Candidatus Thiodiazotropha endolucinida]|nr:hypothetical protein [Candidatus Thiodiazotropha taylori]MCW4250554.1 hypothetical protein [Candidatus Thiodiazotropha endolucinida]MCG7888716.1 hypothetical protein [Candidatus Thiodiazotropha taylori]MCG7952934.1 hypothetical protein [Candidatus Thiodiazotropha taylori]MCG8103337.1 hypothetical protein [Candidatus Thiodiazotropha taylori]
METRRAERALSSLVKSGILKSTRVCHRDETTGDYRGYAIRNITDKFFEALGFTRSVIKKARQRASKRLKKIAYKAGGRLSDIAKVHLATLAGAAPVTHGLIVRRPPPPPDVEEARRRAQQCGKLVRQYPDKPISEIREILEQLNG